MPNYNVGIATPFNYAGVIITPIYGTAVKFFANRDPLSSRLPPAPVGALTFKVTNDNFRPNSITLNNGGNVGIGDTTITVQDGSMFMAGDVLEIDTETVLVTAVTGNALTVSRGYAGTTAAAHTDLTGVAYLIGNSRTGGETEQQAISRIPGTTTQNLQTFQHPYQVAGSLASATEYALPPGVPNFIGRERFYAMQNCQDDIERTCYYGRGVPITGQASRPQMLGLRSLLRTNVQLNPTNAAAYKPTDLLRDAVTPCYTAGGNPDLMLVSTDFMTGLATWGMPLQRLEPGETLFGTPLDVFEAPFVGGIKIWPAPLLRSGTAICLSSGEVAMRVKRPMFDKPRGSRGDAEEGDIIAEQAIEIQNEAHHSFVSGITGFAAA